MSKIVEKVTKSSKYKAWVGTSNDLLRLLKTIETHIEELREDYVEQELKWLRRDLESAQTRLADAEKNLATSSAGNGGSEVYFASQVQTAQNFVDNFTRDLNKAQAKAEAEAPIGLTVHMRDTERRQVSGTADELIDYLTGRDFSRLEFEAPSFTSLSGQDYRVTLYAEKDEGARLIVSSRDAIWTNSLFADATQQMRQRSPKWMVARNFGVLFVILGVLGFYLAWTLLDTIAKFVTPTGQYSEAVMGWMILLVFSAAFGSGAGGAALVRKLIPAFDLSFEGKPNTGSRVMRLVGSTLGAFILGLFVNAVSAGITPPSE